MKGKSFLIEIALILIVGLLSFTWFQGSSYIDAGDFDFPLDWSKYWTLANSAWDDQSSLGTAVPLSVVSILPFGVLGKSLQLLGFSALKIEMIFFYLWFAGGGICFYFLAGVLGLRGVSRLFASLFYMLNPFSLIIIWRVSHGFIQMTYALAPLPLALFAKGLVEKRDFRYLFLANLFWLVIATSTYNNARTLVIYFLPMGIYFLSWLIFKKKERNYLLKYSLIFVVCWLGLNFFWLFPFLGGAKEAISLRHSSVILSDLESVKLTSVKVLDSLRMTGYWSLFSGYKGEPYYPYFSHFKNPAVVAISWLIPLLLLGGLLNQRIRNKQALFFYLGVMVLGLIGLSGANPPFGKILLWVYQQFSPLMLMSRFNFFFYGVPTFLIFSVLIGYGLNQIEDYLKPRMGKYWLILTCLLGIALLVVLVWPFWNGEVIQPERKNFPGERVKIPPYWQEVKEWTEKQEGDFKIFPLPMTKTYNIAFDWEKGYSGVDINRWFTKQPILGAGNVWNGTIQEAIGQAVEGRTESKTMAKLLGFLNVRYLLFREDVRWPFLLGHDWWYAHNPENIGQFLTLQKDLTLVKSFGKVKLYELTAKAVLPWVYSPSKTVWVGGKTKSVADLAPFLEPEEKEGLFFSEQNEGQKNLLLEKVAKIFVWQEPLKKEKAEDDFSKAEYEFSIPRSGEYEIYLRHDGFERYYLNNFLSIAVDNKDQGERNLKIAENNLVSLGTLNLTEGGHRLEIKVPPAKNLIQNPSFEEGLWETIEILSSPTAQKEARITLEKVAFEGEKSVALSSSSNGVAVYTAIKDFKTGDSYKISFAAQHIKGKPPLTAIWQNYDRTFKPHWQINQNQFGSPDPTTVFSFLNLNLHPQWQQYRLLFPPLANTQAAGLAFFSLASEGLVSEESQNLYDDVRVERIFSNPIVLKYLGNSGKLVQSPKITFKKESPVKYKVMVKNAAEPYFLILEQSFHQGWKLSLPSEHFIANTFANGWYIFKTGDYEFTLEFGPQKSRYLGIAVSLGALSFLSALAWLSSRHRAKSQEGRLSESP